MHIFRVIVALYGLCGACLVAQDNPEPVRTFLNAADQTDIRAAGSAPFEIDARVELFLQGKPYDGTYQLSWFAPDHWREEIQLPGYQRIRVGAQKGRWVYRNLDHEILPVAELDAILSSSSRLRGATFAKPEKLRTRKELGASLQCSHLEPRFYDAEDFCFNPQRGTLDVEIFPHGRGNAPNITSHEYSDFAALNGKLFPRSMRALEGKDVVLSVSIDRLVSLDPTSETNFVPPKEAQFWPTCSVEEPGHPITMVQPQYPLAEKTANHSGRVILYALIETDGSVHNLHVVQTASQSLNAAAEDAVGQWRYQPSTCDGAPIPAETFISVVFVMPH